MFPCLPLFTYNKNLDLGVFFPLPNIKYAAPAFGSHQAASSRGQWQRAAQRLESCPWCADRPGSQDRQPIFGLWQVVNQAKVLITWFTRAPAIGIYRREERGGATSPTGGRPRASSFGKCWTQQERGISAPVSQATGNLQARGVTPPSASNRQVLLQWACLDTPLCPAPSCPGWSLC